MKFDKYFAATNSYHGFKSYFHKIFKSDHYERIYVLKGGPGTGKSTFMNSVAKNLEKNSISIERIYCSSDPDSLDGIIGEKSGKRIAILDGTAPHERDAIVPGAIDEIINLGNNWDTRYLSGQKEQILNLYNDKSKAYSAAYFYLSVAGKCEDELSKRMHEEYDIKNLNTLAKKTAESLCSDKSGAVNSVLLSSFGKYGRYSFDVNCSNFRSISIHGDSLLKKQFLTYLYNCLNLNNASMTVIPYSFNDNLIDGIILESSKTIVGLNEDGETINLDEYKRTAPSVFKEYYKFAEQIYSNSMNEAERWFKIASDMHFRLEKIYSASMNFEENTELTESVTNKINSILNT